MTRIATALFLFCVSFATPLIAAEPPAVSDPATAVTAAAGAPVPGTMSLAASRTLTRPGILAPTYVSLAAFQAYDAYSTITVLKRGGYEANPMMRGVASNSTTLLAVKGGTTAATIFVSERLWRGNHRVAAITLMAVTNGVMAAVSAHNASAIRAQR